MQATASHFSLPWGCVAGVAPTGPGIQLPGIKVLEGHGGVEVFSKLWLISTLSTSDRWRGIWCQLQIGWLAHLAGIHRA